MMKFTIERDQFASESRTLACTGLKLACGQGLVSGSSQVGGHKQTVHKRAFTSGRLTRVTGDRLGNDDESSF